MTGDATRTLTVGLTQARDLGDPEKNLEHHLDLIRQASAEGAQVICLQELFRTDYFPATEDPALFDLAEPIPGPTTQAVAALAEELEVVVIVPIFEERAPGIYHNSAAIIDADATLAGVYRKMHIPHDPGFFEKYYFTPGDQGFQAFDTRYGRLGVLICWDQWFPEAARLAALEGAEVLFYPTCIGYAPEDAPFKDDQHEAWQLAQRAHALANGVHVCVANRVGEEAHATFWGQSFVSDPFGRVLAQASEEEEAILVQTLDLSETARVRRAWPFLRDRRIDAYQRMGERFHHG
ncbi:MAG: carbon-nitrogen hydrolase [Candidatus Thermoplasmatota archaeon]|nr:carbon-nitrogen hydrolase [Candidatus Thermoplasmatota archaeon]